MGGKNIFYGNSLQFFDNKKKNATYECMLNKSLLRLRLE